jgi:predicted  nucleic acid-binding Zn-ribbon protein
MGTRIQALLELQTIERDLVQVRRRLRAQERAVRTQQQRIEHHQAEHTALHQQVMERRKEADRLELDLKQREEQVARQRAMLNTVKTNKEYAAILTQINTLRADNSKLEDRVLQVMQSAETVKAQAEQIQQQVAEETARLAEVQRLSAEQVRKLTGMLEDLTARRAEASAQVSPEHLAVFDRLAERHDGEAMAVIQVHGKKPPHEYVCGGCYMSISAENANALRTRDELRTCGHCGRILYLEQQAQKTPAR